MSPVRITNAPQGFEYYKVCDPSGVCRVARGWEEAQRIMQETPGLTATKLPSAEAPAEIVGGNPEFL